ncbi:MAG TPA: hypothetical protein VF532_08025 [Candidatus Angelobacter sp.]
MTRGVRRIHHPAHVMHVGQLHQHRDRLLTKASPFGTLTYTYDAAGNMKTLASSNVGGASMAYAYDPLNRLASVTGIGTVQVTDYMGPEFGESRCAKETCFRQSQKVRGCSLGSDM